MTELPWDDEPVRETDERSRVVQMLLSAIVFTPVLLARPAREIVSTEAALAALIGGVVVGVSTSFATDSIGLSTADESGRRS